MVPVPLPFSNFYSSKLFESLCKRAFEMCDVDSSGQLDVKELHIGVLLAYHQINSRLPIRLNPPSHAEVRDIFSRHDSRGNDDGKLSFDEFREVMKESIGSEKDFTKSIPFKILQQLALNLGIMPLLTIGMQALGDKAGIDAIKSIPAPFLYGIISTLKSYIVP